VKLLPLGPSYGKKASEVRAMPGKAYLGRWAHLLPQVNQRSAWLRGSERQLSRVPFHIACQLDNQSFNGFDAFRKAFWKSVAADPFVSNTYTSDERRERALKDGIAPRANASQRVTQANLTLTNKVIHELPAGSGVILESSTDHADLDSYQLHHHHPTTAVAVSTRSATC
jgi:hypothetical protein